MSTPFPAISRMLGGRLGKHARPGGIWYTAGPWAMLGLTFSWIVLMLRQVTDCIEGGTKAFVAGCYSDIPVLFLARGFSEGKVPFLEADLEYPVLSGVLMDVSRRLTGALGAPIGPGLNAAEVVVSRQVFFGVNAALLFVLFVVLVWAHLRMSRPWDAMMIALSPAVMTTALINWDALVVALTSLSLLAWSKRRPVWAGIWLGLGVAAKLYPLLLLVPLALLCLRASRWRAFFTTTLAALVAWIAVNLPVYLASPAGWLYFWTFNVDRAADLGSLWYALSLSGLPMDHASLFSAGLMVLGGIVVVVVMMLAPQRPRLAQGAFLIIVVFLVANKVYSPQYVLWLLPLLVLARPRWLDWAVFSVAELVYFMAIWGHLAGTLVSGGGGPDRLYILAVFLRIGVQVWLFARVVRDVWRPERDIVRVGGLDDPDGGLLDGRLDAPWLVRLHAGLGRG